MGDQDFGWLQADQIFVGRRKRGFHVTELLDLPRALGDLMIQITRSEPVTLSDLTKLLDRDPVELELQVNQLVAQGWLDMEEDDSGEWIYRVRMAQRQKRALPPGIWQVLDSQWHIPIFRLFPEAVLEDFSHRFKLQEYKPGTILFERGTWGERMYIVDSGKIELLVHNEAGESFVVQEASSGDTFGEMAVLLGERRPHTAHVVEEAQVWTLDKRDLDYLLARHPSAGLTVRRELANNLRPSTRAAEAKSQYNPVIAVGEQSPQLARHLAEHVKGHVVLVDLLGKQPSPLPNLLYIDGQGMRSKAIAETIQKNVSSGEWTVVATHPKMTDQLMRVIGLAEVVIDITGSGAPWLRAVARQYWSMPSITSFQMSRLARKLCGQITGLVLSGGVARTIAHLGVLDVLHKAGIAIDMIASCGYSAIWSVLYAAQRSPAQIIALVDSQARKLRPFGGRLGLRAGSRPGLFDAREVRRWVQSIVQGQSFSDLETPCYLATTDLLAGEIVWATEGHLFSALSACLATPGLVTPVEHQGRLLVDAILENPLPADVVANEGADIVLASSTIPVPGTWKKRRHDMADGPDLVTSWLGMCDAIAHERSLDHLSSVDLIVAPDIAEFSDHAFEQAPVLVERGRQAAERMLPHIRSLLRQEEHLQ